MPYISHLLNKKVRDSADVAVGRLQDILVMPRPGSYPPLEYLMVSRLKDKKIVYIPYRFVQLLSHDEIFLANVMENIPVQESVPQELVQLRRDILDQQIVDVAGVRVVRVNDLRLSMIENRMSVIGIDVSLLGLLRRLGLDLLGGLPFFKVNLIDWRQSKVVHGLLKLDKARLELDQLHPADLANIVEEMNIRHGSKLMTALDAESAAKVFEEVDPRLQQVLLKYLGPEQAADVLVKMPVNEIVDLVKTMSQRDARVFMSSLRGPQLQKVQQLIRYQSDTAGGLMSVDYVTVRPDWTIAQVAEEIKKSSPTIRSILYFYVTGEDGYYYGRVSLRWLIISPPEQQVAALLRHYPPTPTLRPDQEVEEVARLMTKYDLLTAAVLDDEHRMIGLVRIDEVMRCLIPDA